VQQYAREDRLPSYPVGCNVRFVRSEVEAAVRQGRLGA